MSKTFVAALTLAAAQAFSSANATEPAQADKNAAFKVLTKLSLLADMDKSTPQAAVAIDKLFADVSADEGRRFVEFVYGGDNLPQFKFFGLQNNGREAVITNSLPNSASIASVRCAVINPVVEEFLDDEAAVNAENLLGFLKVEEGAVSDKARKNLVASQRDYINVMNQAAASCAKAAPKP